MNQQADLVVHSGLPAGYQTETRRLVRDCCKVVRVVYTAEEVGRGVAANCPISKGSLVEVSECILVPRQEYQEFARHTAFEHYLFHGQNATLGQYLPSECFSLLGTSTARIGRHEQRRMFFSWDWVAVAGFDILIYVMSQIDHIWEEPSLRAVYFGARICSRTNRLDFKACQAAVQSMQWLRQAAAGTPPIE
ncbi:hypothetical protein WJX84_011042 [Apatococcus fuscideae]|uniref:IrrE N-terminal-like domain-containing protein n=1 Tax=Apatococcus fuscideae TaxID=2026836 RepID=A0AAW1T0M7_9CHLO